MNSKSKKINIKNVAQLAKVSVATVSRVLNNSDKVKNETKENVYKIIKELNYEPNMLGKTLRSSESKNILVFIPNLKNLFYTEILEGIEEELTLNGYNTIICSTDLNSDKAEMYLKLLKQKLADGAIVLDPKINYILKEKTNKNLSIVQLCEKNLEENFSFVGIDNEKASYDAVSFLIKKGRKKILLLDSDETFSYAKEREKGYKRALLENNIFYDKNLVIYSNVLGYEIGEKIIMDFFYKKSITDIDSIYAVSDMLAIGVIKALKKLNVEIPKEISVLGFDNIDVAKVYSPELSTVSQPMKKMGEQAARILIEEIQNKNKLKQKIILNHEIIQRETT